MAWRGGLGDEEIWCSASTSGRFWDPQLVIPGIGSLYGPTLAVFGDYVYMAWRGIDDDQNIYWSRSFDGRSWDPKAG